MFTKNNSLKLINWINSRMTGVIYTQKDEIRANCPFCASEKSSDTKAHLYINKEKEVGHCFRCGWAGNIYTLVSFVDHCSYWEALQKISEDGVLYENMTEVMSSLESYVAEKVNELKQEKPEDGVVIVPLSEKKGFNHKVIINYLKNRGVSDLFIFSKFFGAVEDHVAVYMRITETYWSARNIIKDDRIPKYVNATFKKDDILAIWDSPEVGLYSKSRSGEIHIVEGVFSGLRVLRHGYPAIALLGKTATQGQLKRLVAIDRPMKIMLDSDARKESFQLAQKLREMGKCDITIGILETGDPDDNFESHITVAYTLGEIIKERLK